RRTATTKFVSPKFICGESRSSTARKSATQTRLCPSWAPNRRTLPSRECPLAGGRPPTSALLKLRVGRSLGVLPLQCAFPSLLDFEANNEGGSARRKKR